MRSFLGTFLLAVLAAIPGAAGEVVRIKGSDTIGGALAPDLARAFREENPQIEVTVEALGSGTAFVGLLDGSADLGASSRPANAKELEQAAARGVTLREFLLGYDGVAVIVHPANPVTALTVAEISDLFTGKKQRWSEVGGENRPVHRISRPSYSGTHAFFKEKALRRGDAKGTEEFAPDTRFLEDNYEILATVANDPAAVAYVGLGWVDARLVKAVAVALSAGHPPVQPSLESIRTGTYPLYRPLLFYTLGEPSGAPREFLRFALSNKGRQIVSAQGFVPSDAPVHLAATTPVATPHGAKALTTYRLNFPSGATALSNEARETLRAVAERLKSGEFRVLVVGHADAKGPAAANQAVSRARAHAAAAYLREQGVRPNAITIDARAAEEPVATNETAAGRAANRRVDVMLLPLTKP